MKTLFLICGISFAGKSTLAAAIVRRFGLHEVDVDDVKRRRFGAISDDQLTPADWNAIYAQADWLIEQYLGAGDSIVDASRNFRRCERERAREIAARLAARVVTIFVDTPAEIARQRLLENRRNPVRKDIPDADFDGISRSFEPPDLDEQPLVIYRGDKPFDDWDLLLHADTN